MNYIFEIIFKYMRDWENNKNMKDKSMEQLDLILNSNLMKTTLTNLLFFKTLRQKTSSICSSRI